MSKSLSPEPLTQREIANELRLSVRQVKNLTDEGILVRDARLHYDRAENYHRFLHYREEVARKKGSATKEEILTLQAKKLEVEIETSELALARERGQLVTLDYMEGQVTGLLEALRARCLNLPGKCALQLADAETPAAAQAVLEAEIAELLQALSEAGDDPELDAGDDEEPPAASEAAD
jgi:hypothetical protein